MENTIQQLAETGLLGVLLALSLSAITFLYRENKSERDARLKDLQEFAKTDKAFISQIQQALENILALLRRK